MLLACQISKATRLFQIGFNGIRGYRWPVAVLFIMECGRRRPWWKIHVQPSKAKSLSRGVHLNNCKW